MLSEQELTATVAIKTVSAKNIRERGLVITILQAFMVIKFVIFPIQI